MRHLMNGGVENICRSSKAKVWKIVQFSKHAYFGVNQSDVKLMKILWIFEIVSERESLFSDNTKLPTSLSVA